MTVSPRRLRNIFEIIIINNTPRNIPQIFEDYHQQLIEEYSYSYQNLFYEILTGDECFSLSLFIMNELIKDTAQCDDPAENYMFPRIIE